MVGSFHSSTARSAMFVTSRSIAVPPGVEVALALAQSLAGLGSNRPTLT